MHFFSVSERSELKHEGDFPSAEQALRWLTAKPEDESEESNNVVFYISIDDVRRLVQQFLNMCLGKQITKDSHFGIKTNPEDGSDNPLNSGGNRLVYLGDFPDERVAQEVITDSSVATTLAELHGTRPEDYCDIAWVVSTQALHRWQMVVESVVGRKLWETE